MTTTSSSLPLCSRWRAARTPWKGRDAYAQETEPSVFSATSSGYLHLLRERIAQAQQSLERQSQPQGRTLEKAAA